MLQDTDFFDKLADYSNLGGDVSCVVQWSENPSPDEQYEVKLTWKFRGKTMGVADYVIHPVLNDPDRYRLFWINLSFVEEWQKQGLYTTLVKNYAVLPTYGINEVVAVLSDKESERRLASGGFVWVNNDFVLDLTQSS